ncbi:hypothetical protein NC653_035287 [Populus alba x Populus x berolinensis]|uniref:Uncharacterized protein n=1 Tax=Populus alba x Populus x berolinensis TaxID=444605 RepID=A0AAD6PY65_9ROSI|nr:hypothetical protein NC653_035287 [Populus alba x Populus x berolinensis]
MSPLSSNEKITTILKEVKELKRMVACKDEELERKERELEQLSMGFVLFKKVHQHAQTDDQGIIQSLSNNKMSLVFK